MKHYYGWRDGAGKCHVRIEEDGKRNRALPPRNGLYNHSPDGFEWGYGGSGPAQLALALLADALGDDEMAVRLHQRFKFAHVAGWKQEVGWHLSQAAVVALAQVVAADETGGMLP